jgi:PAS domain-containing protein
MTVTPLDPDERAGAVISHTDITERIAAELERQASDARYRAIYEHAPVGIAELTPSGRWLRVNDRFRRIVGEY